MMEDFRHRDPYAHHVDLWWIDRMVPMWSGQWCPPAGSSLARVYEKELQNPWRKWWIETRNKKGWQEIQKLADEYWSKQ